MLHTQARDGLFFGSNHSRQGFGPKYGGGKEENCRLSSFSEMCCRNATRSWDRSSPLLPPLQEPHGLGTIGGGLRRRRASMRIVPSATRP